MLEEQSDYKINKRKRKFIFKKSMDKNIPDEILNRKIIKIGFAAPYWMMEWINIKQAKNNQIQLNLNPHAINA